jgi:hypothetical protein
MVVPSNCWWFQSSGQRAALLEEKDGVTFHTSLPEDRCERLLVKNLGRRMPESAVRGEIECLGIQVQ